MARAKRRLAEKLELARRTGEFDPFSASLRSTFAHWVHGDTYRLREQTLRELEISAEAPTSSAPVETESRAEAEEEEKGKRE